MNVLGVMGATSATKESHYHWLKKIRRTFLVVQCLRICLAMQGTWVWSLVWEDSTFHGATKPVCHDHWSRALQQEKPPQWEACVLHLENSPHSPQLEKTHMRKPRPSAAKNKTKKYIFFPTYPSPAAAHRGEVTCLQSHSWAVARPGPECIIPEPERSLTPDHKHAIWSKLFHKYFLLSHSHPQINQHATSAAEWNCQGQNAGCSHHSPSLRNPPHTSRATGLSKGHHGWVSCLAKAVWFSRSISLF